MSFQIPGASIFQVPRDRFGRYVGVPVCRWLADGRRMELVRPFSFEDPESIRWPVPANAVVDGASIPSALWSFTGGPFEGKYRDASIIHDYYCDTRERACLDTHRVFLFGMLASGAGRHRALAMYMAVRFAGPKWSDSVVQNVQLGQSLANMPRHVGADFQPHLDRPVVDEMGAFVTELEPPVQIVDVVSGNMREVYIGALADDPASDSEASAEALNYLREAKEHFSRGVGPNRRHGGRDLFDFGPPPRRHRP